MRQQNTQNGFTLVELAIVMTIIGLLIGGILKGQELMQNARVTATIAQVRSYEAATTTFRDKYDAMPGDMANAASRIPQCNADCDPVANIGGANIRAGDAIVGSPGWGGTGWATQTTAGSDGNETMLFWTHLLLSDLISGVTTSMISAAPTVAFNETHPAAKINGGFVVGFGDGSLTPGEAGTAAGPSGMLLVLVQAPATGGNAAMQFAGQQPLIPTRAAQIDRKMDDGRPNNGYVHAYGVGASCFNIVAPFSPAEPGYLENVTLNNCGLFFRIQG